MSARRQILEDSDDSVSEDAGSSSSLKFLTEDQVSEIRDCNIKAEGDGTYSADAMNDAISKNEENLVNLDDEHATHNYQSYQVIKDKCDAFLSKPIWSRSGAPSEEVLLLEIEALRRSSKRTKITMFKLNSKTGGQIIFGPWWNHALQRIVKISTDNTGDELDWENYTASRILLSLFAFITESQDVVKKGKLADLKSTFGVDWDSNVKAARKVINRCAKGSILDEECRKCELYVDSIRGALPSDEKTKAQDSVPTTISLKPTYSDNGNKKEQDDEDKKKREDEARKKRMAAMKASQRRASAFSVSIEQSRAKVDAAPTLSASSSMADPHPQPSAPQNETQNQMKPPPPVKFTPPVQPTPNDNLAKQSHTAAKNTSSMYKIISDDTKIQSANANTSFASQANYSYGQSHEPKQSSSHDMYKQNDMYKQTNGSDQMRPREDDAQDNIYRSQHDSDRNYGYKDRSSDYDRKRNARYEKSDSRDSSREYNPSRSYNNGPDYEEERPPKRFRGPRNSEKSSNNYDSSATNGRETERWQPKREPKASSYDNTSPGFKAPVAGAGAGRGRGRGRGGVDNRPAWMTQAKSAPTGSTAIALAPAGGSQSAADPGPAFTAPVASVGRGRGRGGVDNRPAWMTQAESNNGAVVDTQQSSTMPMGQAAFPAPPSGGGRGRGRGRGGVDNRPAWMTKGQNAPGETRAAVDTQQSSTMPMGQAAFSAPPSGGGRGRGRGGVDNRPAWMTKGLSDASTPGTVAPSGSGGMGRGRGRGIDNRPAWMSQQDEDNN